MGTYQQTPIPATWFGLETKVMANFTVFIKPAVAVESIEIKKITSKTEVAAKSMATMIFNKEFESSLSDAIIVVVREDNKACFVRLFGDKWTESTVKDADLMLYPCASKQFKVIFLDMYGFTRKAEVLTAKTLTDAKVAASKMQKAYKWSNAIMLCDDTDNLVSQKRLNHLKGRMVWLDYVEPALKKCNENDLTGNQ